MMATTAWSDAGRLEINQACAVGQGCFPGDAPGFPVRLAEPGSYLLTGDLVVPSGASALSVAADDVWVDLGGFTISGSASAEDLHDLYSRLRRKLPGSWLQNAECELHTSESFREAWVGDV